MPSRGFCELEGEPQRIGGVDCSCLISKNKNIFNSDNLYLCGGQDSFGTHKG